MRREPTELPFSGPSTRRAQVPVEDDDNITYVDGRAFRRESTRHDPDNTITPDELKTIHQRRLEAAEARQAEADANLAAALRVGEAFKVLDGDG